MDATIRATAVADKKYKRCCLEKDQRAHSAVLLRAAAERLLATSHHHHDHAHCDFCDDTFGDDDCDELTTASNAIVDMVHDGKLDEAE